jgi:hypothetical protein
MKAASPGWIILLITRNVHAEGEDRQVGMRSNNPAQEAFDTALI